MPERISLALQRQLVATFDASNDITLDAIAKAFALEKETVYLELSLGGSKRLETAGKQLYGSVKVFKASVYGKALDVIERILDSDNEEMRYKAARFIVEAGNGMCAPAKALTQINQTFTIHDLNVAIQQQLDRVDGIKRPVVDVEVDRPKSLPILRVAEEISPGFREELPEGDYCPA